MAISRHEHNVLTGEISIIPVDDAWVLAHFLNELQLTSNLASVTLNGSINLSIQLFTPILNSGSRQALNSNIPFQLKIGLSVINGNLVNGQWSDSIQFVSAGTFEIFATSHISNILSIGVS